MNGKYISKLLFNVLLPEVSLPKPENHLQVGKVWRGTPPGTSVESAGFFWVAVRKQVEFHVSERDRGSRKRSVFALWDCRVFVCAL